MNLRHLRIFTTVVECENMHKAARRLFISQPSVSQAVAEIEKEFGVPLFERLSKKLYLTDAGKTLLSYARHILQSFDKMEQEMRSLPQAPRLYLGGSVTVGTCLMDHVVAQLEKKVPGVEVFVTVNNTAQIEGMILNNELDAAIVEGSVRSGELFALPVCQDELVVVAGKRSPFYEKKTLTLEQLQGAPLISREAGSAERNQFEQYCEDKGISFTRKWQCTNTEAIKNAVIHGRGIAILSRLLVEGEAAEGTLRILPLEGVRITRTMKLIYHKNKYLSWPLKALLELSGQGRLGKEQIDDGAHDATAQNDGDGTDLPLAEDK